MLFLTYWFVLFAAVTFPLYWIVRQPTVRMLLLLVSCVVFHTNFAGPAGVLPVIVLAVATYFAGLTRNKPFCVSVIVLSVAALVFYKYTKFLSLELTGLVAPEFRTYLLSHERSFFPQAPPLAISFFVFEFVHYLVDVCRGSPTMRSPLDFSLYTLFWPSIVAGPVKRYQDFVPALHHGIHNVGGNDVAAGMLRVALGFVKKVAADNLTAYVTFTGNHFEIADLPNRWFFLVAISLRILLDFSGYSDMAIGFAQMHGIRLPENFNFPYLATSLTDFWHRWHISLSSWIRDYIYIALGGSRKGLVRKVVNGLLAFGICGLWHGAGWNFLVWGLYHGVGLAINSSYRNLLGRRGQAIAAWMEQHPVFGWMVTMLFVGVGWLFFFYPLPVAWKMLQLLFGM